VLAVEESKQRRDARFAVTAGTLPSQPNKAFSEWQKRNCGTIPFMGDFRGDIPGTERNPDRLGLFFCKNTIIYIVSIIHQFITFPSDAIRIYHR